MAKYNLTWEPGDAQLLDALLLATGGEGGAGLQDVLLMADAVDGTVFTLEELEQGLEKLISVGFVSIQKNKLSLAPEFLERYEAITLEEAHATEDQKPLLKLLEQQELRAEKIEEVRAAVLKKYKLKNYYQQYQEQFG
jgi:F0F1-type ATP synthase epsilon subunit